MKNFEKSKLKGSTVKIVERSHFIKSTLVPSTLPRFKFSEAKRRENEVFQHHRAVKQKGSVGKIRKSPLQKLPLSTSERSWAQKEDRGDT